MNATPFSLTFGVELEFLVRFNLEDFEDELLAAEGKLWSKDFSPALNHKYGILVRQHMIQILNKYGFSTNDLGLRDFSKWTVATDGTVTPSDTSGNWYAIELKSPVLDFSDPALEQVKTVVELLRSKFRLFANKSCGLHVHVGNEDKGFSMPTLKNFCKLITVFEHQLNSLHPPHRLQNSHAKSTQRAFYPGASREEKLLIIDKLRDLDELVFRYHYIQHDEFDKYMAFNFLNLQEDGLDEPLHTIEFRQHRGTLDTKRIMNWVMVACSLVELSHTETAGFQDLIEKHSNNTKYTVIDLFKDLNLLDLAEFYTPLVFPQYGTEQIPAWMQNLIED